MYLAASENLAHVDYDVDDVNDDDDDDDDDDEEDEDHAAHHDNISMAVAAIRVCLV